MVDEADIDIGENITTTPVGYDEPDGMAADDPTIEFSNVEIGGPWAQEFANLLKKMQHAVIHSEDNVVDINSLVKDQDSIMITKNENKNKIEVRHTYDGGSKVNKAELTPSKTSISDVELEQLSDGQRLYITELNTEVQYDKDDNGLDIKGEAKVSGDQSVLTTIDETKFNNGQQIRTLDDKKIWKTDNSNSTPPVGFRLHENITQFADSMSDIDTNTLNDGDKVYVTNIDTTVKYHDSDDKFTIVGKATLDGEKADLPDPTDFRDGEEVTALIDGIRYIKE